MCEYNTSTSTKNIENSVNSKEKEKLNEVVAMVTSNVMGAHFRATERTNTLCFVIRGSSLNGADYGCVFL